MGYHIDARLEDGQPRLEVQDAATRSIRLVWEPRRSRTENPRTPLEAEVAIDELFRRLFLLTTEDYLKHRRGR